MKWIIPISLFVIISGCSLEKRIIRTQQFIEKHDEVLDKYRDTLIVVEYDTLITPINIYDTITVYIEKTDTVSDDTEVKHVYDSTNLDEWGSPWHTETDTVKAKSGLAEGIAYVKDGTLFIEVWQNEDILKIPYDTLVNQVEYWKSEYTNELLRINVKAPIKWYYKAAVWILVGEIIILLLIWLISLILKRMKK